MFNLDNSTSAQVLADTQDASAFLTLDACETLAVFVTPTGAYVFEYSASVNDWYVVHSIAYTPQARESVLYALLHDTRTLYALATGALVESACMHKRALWAMFYRTFDGV